MGIGLAETLGKALRRASARELFRQGVPYVRGFLLSFRFEQRAFVSAGRKIQVIKQNGLIRVGDFTTLWPQVKLSAWSHEGRAPAEIRLGNRCSIGDRTEIHAGQLVEIGDETIIAWDCVIMDRDYHSTTPGVEGIRPVRIGNRVWIGCRAIVLKGVTIGDNAVVAAGAVVTKNVEPFTLVAGSPARVVRRVEGWKSNRTNEMRVNASA